MPRLHVRDVMTSPAVTLAPSTPAREAARVLHTHWISGAPVTDDEGELLGVVTEADLVPQEGVTARETVGEVMTTSVQTAGPDEELRTVGRRLVKARLRQLPVVAGTKVIGVVARRDLLGVFDRSDRELVAAVGRFLTECAFVPPDADIHVDSTDGVITLNGYVLYESDVRVAGSLAASVDGVMDVVNNLAFQAPNPGLRNIEFARSTEAWD